jgi:hypothetical protein
LISSDLHNGSRTWSVSPQLSFWYWIPGYVSQLESGLRCATVVGEERGVARWKPPGLMPPRRATGTPERPPPKDCRAFAGAGFCSWAIQCEFNERRDWGG